MAYATTDDMIARFGARELIQLSTPAGQDMDGVVVAVVQQALDDASARADSYLRMKYRTPLDVAPPEVLLNVCHLARYELSAGNDKTASDDVKNRRDEAIAWLREIRDGKVKLDLLEVSDDDESTATMSERADSTWCTA
jgi:phage gp36-like protein